MKIIMATDHAGFELKEKLKEYLAEEGHEVQDMGAHAYDEVDDYPDFIAPAAKKVAETNGRGIILGGSGQGEAIVANKIKGIRAVVYYGGSLEIIKFSSIHNNSNILSLGARFLTENKAKEAVKLWLETEFPGEERHKRRIEKIPEL